MGNRKGIFQRTEILFGEDKMQKIAQKRVIIFGIGGVGSWCAESLVRSGIEHLTLVDSDRIALSNINRQLHATTKTVGEVKTEVLRNRLLEINPEAQIKAVQKIYNWENRNEFRLEEYDYIIDAIDSLSNKVDLIRTATRTNAVFFSSLGASLKLDPTKIRVAEFWKVRGCPLGAKVRKRLKRGDLPARPFLCVYSEELLENKISAIDNEGKSEMGNSSAAPGNPDLAVPMNSNLEAPGNPDLATSGNLVQAPTYNPVALLPGNPDLAAHDWSTKKAVINGTVAHITAIYGFTLAGLVIQDIYYNA